MIGNSEVLLVVENRGPLTWFAPTRSTYQDENDQIGREVLSGLNVYGGTTQSVGQVCMTAVKALAAAKPFARVRAASYTFFGDPTIIMAWAWGDTPTDVSSGQDRLPKVTALYQNVPNPFNPTTTIRFDLAHDGNVELAIFNVGGRRVRTIVQKKMLRNRYAIQWDGQDDVGRSVSSGIYFYKLRTDDLTATKKLVVLK